MILHFRYIVTTLIVALAVRQIPAQEAVPPKPGETAPAGVDKKYFDLSHSKDAKTKGLADRYIGLLKFQEWGDASGKFTTVARYVSHDPELTHVKLAMSKGSGKDRVIKEVEVEVAKLNKVCQSRVKQIDAIQKKLDELAGAAKPGDVAATGQAGPEGQGGPPSRNAAGPEAGPPPQAAAEQPDPSASEPDPLGFAELPPVAAGAPVGPGAGPIEGTPAPGIPTPVPGQPGGAMDRKQWRNDFAAFASNISASVDPAGQYLINFGEIRELGEMNNFAAAHKDPAKPRSPEEEDPAAISQRLGDVKWQLVVDKIEQKPGGLVTPHFRIPELPKPFEIQFALADGEPPQNWSSLAPGAAAPVTGRIIINEPNKILVKVKLAPK